ncbi:MAG: glycosyltransferase [Nostocaceae cyanobacterium]|nr:glycosyltransferase [Nostocaceae cyanobacterium]
MNSRILIIGNTSEVFHIGSMFTRAAKEINLTLAVSDTNINSYAPSLKHLWGKAFFKISGKRPIEWWSFNHKIIALIEEFYPKIVLITGIIPLQDDVFNMCDKIGAKVVNYLTDSPWSRQNSHPKFMANLPKYDFIFSTKKALIPDLINFGVKQVKFLPFAFDPFVHRYLPPENILICESQMPDVCLVGGADKDRINFIRDFLIDFDGKLGLYGTYWDKDQKLKQYYRGVVLGDDFCKVLQKCKINIGVVRRANRDEHSMRSYEIPACGGVGIYEDTCEHRDLFLGYPQYGFFTSPKDLADKSNWLLEHPLELEQMRQLGIQMVVKESNTYTARLRTILDVCSN